MIAGPSTTFSDKRVSGGSDNDRSFAASDDHLASRAQERVRRYGEPVVTGRDAAKSLKPAEDVLDAVAGAMRPAIVDKQVPESVFAMNG